MDRSAAGAIAPTRHNDRARRYLSSFAFGPLHGSYERRRRIGFPIREQDLSVRRESVDDFRAQNAVRAVTSFQIAIVAKRFGGDRGRQVLSQGRAEAAKTRIEHRDTHALP